MSLPSGRSTDAGAAADAEAAGSERPEAELAMRSEIENKAEREVVINTVCSYVRK